MRNPPQACHSCYNNNDDNNKNSSRGLHSLYLLYFLLSCSLSLSLSLSPLVSPWQVQSWCLKIVVFVDLVCCELFLHLVLGISMNACTYSMHQVRRNLFFSNPLPLPSPSLSYSSTYPTKQVCSNFHFKSHLANVIRMKICTKQVFFSSCLFYCSFLKLPYGTWPSLCDR